MTKVGKFYVYATTPVDLWHPLRTQEEVVRELYTHRDGNDRVRELEQLVKQALTAVRESGLGWEGDISEGPYIIYLPFEVQVGIAAITIKQGHKGTTFFASLVPLPHLEALE